MPIIAGCLDTARKSTSGGNTVPRVVLKTEYQLADMFTKALPEERFQYLADELYEMFTPVRTGDVSGNENKQATPNLSFMRPFGCHVTILNTIDHLGKSDGKAGEGFFVGYSLNSKALELFNSRTRIQKKTCNRFSESTPKCCRTKPVKDYILLPLWTANPPYSQDPKNSNDDGSKPLNDDGKKVDEDPIKDSECNITRREDNVNQP
ncbi:hypothetical protein Tco_0232263 [Tanacetum coccineum]